MTSLTDYQIQHTKYKWEFLRRKPDYIKDWEKLQDVLGNKYGDRGPPDERYSTEETMFCLEWQIAHPLSPDKSYDDIDFTPGEEVLVKERGLDRLMFEWLNPEFLFDLPIRIVDGWAYAGDYDKLHRYVSDKIGETGKLNVEIDLNFSKSRLTKEFKILLDKWKMLYEDAYKKKLYRNLCKERNIHSFPIDKNLMKEFEKIYRPKLKKRNQKYEKKYHFDNFDDYLKVYDLRNKRITWAKITSELKLNSIQTARNHYKAACEIIDKGIDLYVK